MPHTGIGATGCPSNPVTPTSIWDREVDSKFKCTTWANGWRDAQNCLLKAQGSSRTVTLDDMRKKRESCVEREQRSVAHRRLVAAVAIVGVAVGYYVLKEKA